MSLSVTIGLLWVIGLGCGKGQTAVPGLDHFRVGVQQSHLYVSFISTTLQWDMGLTVPIPGVDDSTISVAPNLNSPGTVFQFSISLAALLNQGKPLPKTGLPDGRPLPDIQGGVLPRWDSQIKDLMLSLYLSNEAFGLFVPLQLSSSTGVSLPFMVSVSIQDERGNLLGKAYAIPSNESGSGSGLFVLLPYLGAEPPPAGSP